MFIISLFNSLLFIYNYILYTKMIRDTYKMIRVLYQNDKDNIPIRQVFYTKMVSL